VLERLGLGAHGAVYRALHAHSPSSPVALKLARHPRNPRFARERELLSRIHHPHVPRLLDHGEWQIADFGFPFLVMEWVDGLSLYDWARLSRPSSRQVLLTLSRLASALAATHSAGGLHRDFKGDNVLIREPDGWPFLTDFGSGHFLGAAPLTEPPFPPGTPDYRAPEAWRFVHLAQQQPAIPYSPTASDDVFALGVTAYRLLTGEYPSLPDSAFRDLPRDEAAPLSPRALTRSGPTRAAPHLDQKEPGPTLTRSGPTLATPRGLARAVRSKLTAASLGGALALGAAWLLSLHPGVEFEKEHASRPEETRDGGTVAVGNTALTAPVPLSQAPFAWSTVAMDVPPKPLPGQRRPDAKGRCPDKALVPINGGCWIKLSADLKDCEEQELGYIYKGECYTPLFSRPRPPTSSPVKRPENSSE
jgi:serine/threonine-protein kinase